MSRSLSALVLILSEGLHNYKCTDCESFHENLSIKDNQLSVQNVIKIIIKILIMI